MTSRNTDTVNASWHRASGRARRWSEKPPPAAQAYGPRNFQSGHASSALSLRPALLSDAALEASSGLRSRSESPGRPELRRPRRTGESAVPRLPSRSSFKLTSANQRPDGPGHCYFEARRARTLLLRVTQAPSPEAGPGDSGCGAMTGACLSELSRDERA